MSTLRDLATQSNQKSIEIDPVEYATYDLSLELESPASTWTSYFSARPQQNDATAMVKILQVCLLFLIKKNATEIAFTEPSRPDIQISLVGAAKLNSLTLFNVPRSCFKDLDVIGSKLEYVAIIQSKSESDWERLDQTAPPLFPNVKRLKIVDCLSESLLHHFPNVEFLNLSGNKMENIPKLVGNCRNLIQLDMQSNVISSLSSLIPSPLSPNLSMITQLSLMQNQLETLEGIEQLLNLRKLDVSFNKVWGE